MDFFKSVFATDADPQNLSASHPNSPNYPSQQPRPDQNPNPNSWPFGGLMKTLATQTESMIETYRRDLSEFSSGLKNETAAIRNAVSGVVIDLPASLDAGASVAQESLESVGQAIDDLGSSVWRGTAEIISRSKDALLAVDDHDSDSSDPQNAASSSSSLNYKRYSRFEAQVLGIQSDLGTYRDEPEDSEDFGRWKLGFVLEDNAAEIENLCGENGVLEGIYEKLVPSFVDHETFWCRYFYRIYKLKVIEDARASLVKRAISREDDEDLSWDVEDYDEEEITDVSKHQELEKKVIAKKKPIEEKCIDNIDFATESVFGHGSVEGLQSIEKRSLVESNTDVSLVVKLDEKMPSEGKGEAGESCRHSDYSIVSSQTSVHEEEDLGWDEIEDLGNIEEKKIRTATNSCKDDLRKRVNAADEEEDLSWDIEDD